MPLIATWKLQSRSRRVIGYARHRRYTEQMDATQTAIASRIRPLFRLPERPSHGPNNSVCECALVASILPNGCLVPKRRIKYSPLAVRSGPGQRPAVESLMHTRLAKVHRALVEAQQHV